MSISKIAVFHNLKQGGANNYINSVIKQLSTDGYSVDLYTLNPDIEKKPYYNLFCSTHKEEKKLISFLFNYYKYLRKIAQIALKIKKGNYKYVLISHCYITQTPPIFTHLEKILKRVVYIYHEPKREFYEKTSFDHYSPNRATARLLRYFLKVSELRNIRIVKNIVCCSFYSREYLKKITNKSAHVIYPFDSRVVKHTKYKGVGFSSVTEASYLKGFRETEEFFIQNPNLGATIVGINKKHSKQIRYYERLSKKEYTLTLKRSRFYMANNKNEPLGLATIEAANTGNILYATNTGSHNEIIKLGINGYMYPIYNSEVASKVFLNSDKELSKYIKYKFNWNRYVTILLSLCKK